MTAQRTVRKRAIVHGGPTLRHGWGCSVHKPVAKYRAKAMGFCNRREYDIGLCTGLERRGRGYPYARDRLTRGGGGTALHRAGLQRTLGPPPPPPAARSLAPGGCGRRLEA